MKHFLQHMTFQENSTCYYMYHDLFSLIDSSDTCNLFVFKSNLETIMFKIHIQA